MSGVNNVVYVKVGDDDPAVVALAKALGESPKVVAATINQERYRKAYNKVKQEKDKVMRAWFKAHPEMMKEVK